MHESLRPDAYLHDILDGRDGGPSTGRLVIEDCYPVLKTIQICLVCRRKLFQVTQL